MDLGLKGKTAIICASSKGLGKACATALAQEGCLVVINGRHEKTLHDAAEDIVRQTGAQVTAIAADISTPEGQKAILAACPAPDILVNNNAGPPYRDFHQLNREVILEGVTQNMVTPIELIQAVIDGMTMRKFGRIINITSTSIYSPIPGLDLSSGARAGLTSLLAGIARTVAPHNVTINNILPGPFETERIIRTVEASALKANSTVESILEKRRQENPAKRFGRPEELGRLCAFLASDHAGYMTGQNLILDGGAYLSAF